MGEEVVPALTVFDTVWLGFVRSRGLVLIRVFAVPKVPSEDEKKQWR